MFCRWFILFCLLTGILAVAGELTVAAQETPPNNSAQKENDLIDAEFKTVSNSITLYYDPAQGISSIDLIRRALASNNELAAIRLDLARARARVQQARLRPNPSLDFEYQAGRLTGSPDEGTTSVGISLPIELGAKRGRRIDLAEAELATTEAEIADRERRLAADIYSAYGEALAAMRELEIITRLSNIETQTTNIVEVRVKEGENPPLDLNLLRAEIGRLQARRILVEARLQGAMIKLKNFIAMPIAEPLKLREDLTAVPLTAQPGRVPNSIEEALEIALRNRPDLKLARLNETVAQAGLRLARAQAVPDLTVFSKYSRDRSAFDNTPVGPIRDKDNLVSFGVSINLPIFNRNQGGQAEAATVITQATRRREFAEQVVRAEVTVAFARYQAAQAAVEQFAQNVVARSAANVRVFREAYQLGEFRITDLLAEQRRFVDSQREYTEALLERYRGFTDLQTAIGITINP